VKDSKGNITALIVDDRRASTQDFVKIADMEGINAVAATSVDRAVEVLQESHFDVMICDLMMPGDRLFSELETQGGLRTGIFLCQYVRLHFPDMIILVLTARTVSDFDRDFLFGLGIKIFNKSDITQIELVEHIKKLEGTKPQITLFDTIELKLGIFGLEVDLKKAATYLARLRSRRKG
jgi:CheY-like chemotaxis protein